MAERVHLLRIGYGYAITGSLPPAAIGDAYSRTLTAIGGVGIKRLEIVSETVTDAITFTDNGDSTADFEIADPQTAGTYSVVVRATDADRQRWTRTFTLQVVALPLAITGTLANCTVGSAYSDTLTVSGGVAPYSLDSYTLPAGLTANLAGDTITISGTPTGAGLGPGTSFNFDAAFAVSDAIAGEVTFEQAITITVTAVVAVFDPTPLLDASDGDAYTADTNASGGTGGYTFSKQAGPTWLSVNSGSGAITGTPGGGDIGTGITVTVRATDSEGNIDDVTDTIDVTPAGFSYRYFRVRIPRTQGGNGHVALAAVEMAATVSGADLCTTETNAISSSFYDVPYQDDNAFDGDDNTVWASAFDGSGNGSYAHYIGYDFGTATFVAEIRIKSFGPGYSGATTEQPKDVHFEGSSNGSSWTTLRSDTTLAAWSALELRAFAL